MTYRFLIALVSIAVPAVVVGCSAAPETNEATAAGPTFETLIEQALTEASDTAVDTTQVVALERAQSAGEVPVGDFLAQRQLALSCMQDAGLIISDVEEREINGHQTLDADMRAPEGMTDEQALQLADDCNYRFALLLETVYMQQPSALDAYFARIESHREVLIECFAEYGVVVEHDAPVGELFQAAEEVNLIAIDQTGSPYDCMLETGAYE